MFYEGLYLYQKTGGNTARTLYIWKKARGAHFFVKMPLKSICRNFL
jgi:hypothetical protein